MLRPVRRPLNRAEDDASCNVPESRGQVASRVKPLLGRLAESPWQVPLIPRFLPVIVPFDGLKRGQQGSGVDCPVKETVQILLAQEGGLHLGKKNGEFADVQPYGV